jgi:uncharacterized protein
LKLQTVKKWLSLLETSGILFVLPPHFKNFKKRIVKTPTREGGNPEALK